MRKIYPRGKSEILSAVVNNKSWLFFSDSEKLRKVTFMLDLYVRLLCCTTAGSLHLRGPQVMSDSCSVASHWCSWEAQGVAQAPGTRLPSGKCGWSSWLLPSGFWLGLSVAIAVKGDCSVLLYLSNKWTNIKKCCTSIRNYVFETCKA